MQNSHEKYENVHPIIHNCALKYVSDDGNECIDGMLSV